MRTLNIITGAKSGLGYSLSLAMLNSGEDVLSISRKSNNKENELSLGKFNNFYDITHDFNSRLNFSEIEALKHLQEFEKVVFLNNACIINPIKPFSEIANLEVNESLMVNIVTPMDIVGYLLKHCLDQKIDFINITSGASDKSIANWSLYSSSKAYMRRLFEILKTENIENKKLRFVSLDPGMLDTKMQADIRNSNFPQNSIFVGAKENGKLISPDDAARDILSKIKQL